MGLVSQGNKNGNAPSNLVVVTTGISVFDQVGLEIGYIENLDRTDNRPTTLIKHLNKADAGRSVEQVPGIEGYTLSASGYALYNSSNAKRRSIINRLVGSEADAFVTMAQQTTPFAIRQEETHPATLFTQITYFLGCMLTNYSRPVSIGTVTIAEKVNITAMYIEAA